MEAWHVLKGGGAAAFHAELDRVVWYNAFGCGPRRWNPLSATVEEWLSGACPPGHVTILERLAADEEAWPSDAGEALGFPRGGSRLADLPEHVAYDLMPWTALTPEQIDQQVRHWAEVEAREQGLSRRAARRLLSEFGVAPVEVLVEVERTLRLAASIRDRGYARDHGDVAVVVVRRDSDHRYLVRQGRHRSAVMSALGAATVPARILPHGVFDLDDLDYWPQVRAGRWSRDEARSYVDRLFDFDSLAWAKKRGLLPRPVAAG